MSNLLQHLQSRRDRRHARDEHHNEHEGGLIRTLILATVDMASNYGQRAGNNTNSASNSTASNSSANYATQQTNYATQQTNYATQQTNFATQRTNFATQQTNFATPQTNVVYVQGLSPNVQAYPSVPSFTSASSAQIAQQHSVPTSDNINYKPDEKKTEGTEPNQEDDDAPPPYEPYSGSPASGPSGRSLGGSSGRSLGGSSGRSLGGSS